MKELTEERWKRLEELFRQALELPVAEHPDFIERQTRGDADLERQLAGMLSHASSAGKSIFQTIADVAKTASPQNAWTGRYFGPYRVLREIGRGGMGLVFEAVRDDDEYHKRVALKVAPEWRDAMLHDRIRHERQILAELEHPNIARLLDGGTEDGVPYFAMEFVEGSPITSYAAGAGLTIRERVHLFRQVLSAVNCAHEALVVHRDLKPSNILVTCDGVPKLLDFGIAKMLNPREPNDKTALGMIWTPDYTSPEQVRGKPVTVRTDVYSLGLVLYELLCGERGQRADASSPLALDRTICETDPAFPSTHLSAKGKLPESKQVRGDLDTIVSTAIQKEPERRYGSVAELNAELARYLEGRPVLARPGTLSYRAGKYVRRHRGVVAASLLALAAIGTGIVATLHQARRAERRFEQVRKLANAFVFDVHDRIEALPGSTEARKSIVQTALVYLENLRQEAGGDKELLRELAAAYDKIGDVQGNPSQSNIGDRAGAVSSFRNAEQILSFLVRNGDQQAVPALAGAYTKIGVMLKEQGDAKGALAEFNRGRETVEPVLMRAPQDRATLEIAGNLYSELTRLLFALNDKSVHEVALRSMEIARTLVASDPLSANNRVSLAGAYSNVGTAWIGKGNPEMAAGSYRQAVHLREQLVKEHPNHTVYRRGLMVGYGHLGDVLGLRAGENLGDYSEAAQVYRKALETAEWLHAQDKADQKALFDVASAQVRLGSVLLETQPQAGLERLQQAENNLNLLLAQDSGNYRFRYYLAFVDRKFADGLTLMKKDREAARRLERSIATATGLTAGPEAAAAKSHLLLAKVRLALLSEDAQVRRAASLADEVAQQLSAKPQFLNAWNQAVVYGDLGRALRRLGRERDAAKWLQQAIEQWRELRIPEGLAKRRASEVTALESELALLRK